MNMSQILRAIFNHEAIIVLIKGDWKTGKTNTGLKIVEDLLKLGIIKIAATNIEIEESEKIKKIVDLPTLQDFHFDHPRHPKDKAFIFDEAGKITSRRSAMSKMNRSWFEFIPELSKGRCRLIVITQSEYISDSIFVNTQFTKAIFTTYKYGNRYDVAVSSELFKYFKRQYFKGFPKCDIKYNPYGSAEWYLERKAMLDIEPLCCRVARLYGIENISTTKIAQRLGVPNDRTKVTRLLKLHLKHTLMKLNKEDLEELKEINDFIKS